MASSADNVKLGVCNVLFDGVDLGYTKGGVEVEVQTTTHEVTVDQHGTTPLSELITGRTVTATVPLAETTLENLVAIMPGATLVSDGKKAAGSVTLSALPEEGDSVAFADTKFEFVDIVVKSTDVEIGATVDETAANLAARINASVVPYVATVSAGVVTITAKATGEYANTTITLDFDTPASATKTDIAGGVDATHARVDVTSGININLLSVAKTLVLRPRGTNGEDDFIIHRAACPGALNFAYQTDAERIYSAAFKGYVLDDGRLFSVGDVDA